MDISAQPELVPFLRIVLATVLGGVVGWEREKALRPAGLRTHMTVALAAALFTTLAHAIARSASSVEMEGVRIDPTRVLEAVVTGVSFLGAGTIFSARGGSTVKGLTTAASLLATAAVGVATAVGAFGLAIACTALLLVVLALVRRLEPAAHAKAEERADSSQVRVPARAP